MQKVRAMLGLWVTTGSRNEYTNKSIIAYGKICEVNLPFYIVLNG
jgi:hypothetical protein